jgi:hypothetical protein
VHQAKPFLGRLLLVPTPDEAAADHADPLDERFRSLRADGGLKADIDLWWGFGLPARSINAPCPYPRSLMRRAGLSGGGGPRR